MAARRKTSARNPPTRRSTSAARPASYYPEVREQRGGRWYTARWHRVKAWSDAALALAGFEDVAPDDARPRARVRTGSYYRHARDARRVEQHAVAGVRDLTDAEEAFERGRGLHLLERLPDGPGRAAGGVRRVVITALTWTPDYEGEVGYDPAWITLGHGMTAKTAAAAAARFVRDYTRALNARVVSRELVFTALEIKFWTAPAGAKYV